MRRLVSPPKERRLAIRGGLELCARIWGDEEAAGPAEVAWLRPVSRAAACAVAADIRRLAGASAAEPVVGAPRVPRQRGDLRQARA